METTILKVYERIGWSNEEATLRFLWTDNHRIWNCEKFQQINFGDCFKVAKEKCLSVEHRGKDCNRSRQCGAGGCQLTHHRLLHDTITVGNFVLFLLMGNYIP